MKRNFIKAGAIVLITLVFGFISCKSEDEEPVVTAYGSTTLANQDTLTLRTSLANFASVSGVVTDWVPGLKDEGGSVSASGSGNSVTLTFTTSGLKDTEWNGTLKVLKTAFIPALASDVNVTNVKLIRSSGSALTDRAKDLAATISKDGAVSSSLVSATNQSNYIAFDLGSINLSSASATINSVTLSTNTGATTPLDTSSVKITSETQAQLLLDPQTFVSDDSFYGAGTYNDGVEDTNLKWIKIGFTVTDAAGGTATGTITISPDWNDGDSSNTGAYTALETALQAVNDVRSTLTGLKTPLDSPYAHADLSISNYGNVTIDIVTDINSASFSPKWNSSVTISSAPKQDSGAAKGLLLTGSGTPAVSAIDGYSGTPSSDNVTFTNVQLNYSGNFVYNYYGSVTVLINES